MGRRPNPKIETYPHKDGSITYRVRVRVNGRQTTETFDSEPAAAVFVARVKDPAIGADRAVALRDREDARSSDYVPTVREMLTFHLEQLTGVEGRTKDDYLAVAGRTWLPKLGNLRVDEITRLDVARFVNSMEGGSKPKTIKNAHSILSSVLETAVQEKHITHNPARGTRLPRAGEQDVEEIRFLTHAEFDQLYQAIPEPYRPLILLLFGTGLRWSEATALQVGDIDQEASTLRVVRAWKKARKPDRGWVIGPPKTRKSRRTIVMPTETRDAIRPLLEGRAGSAWLFTTKTGVAVRHNNFYNRIWVPSCEAAGLEPRPRIHDARHTHASWLLAQGVPIHVASARLGHESITTTVNTYGHLMPDMLTQASAAASAAFAATSIGALPAGQSSST